MALRAAWATSTLAIATALAHADAPQPTPAPPERSWYATAQPSVTDETPHVRHVVQRGGLFVLGGGTWISSTMNARLDIGVPAPLRSAPRLRVVLTTEGGYGTDADTTRRRSLSLTPTLQYEWHVPFELAKGELLFIAAAGLRRTTLWLEQPDAPFYPSAWESQTTYAGRLAAGIEYRRRNGLIVSAQPLGVTLPFGDPQPPTPRWMEPKQVDAFAASALVGFQFR